MSLGIELNKNIPETSSSTSDETNHMNQHNQRKELIDANYHTLPRLQVSAGRYIMNAAMVRYPALLWKRPGLALTTATLVRGLTTVRVLPTTSVQQHRRVTSTRWLSTSPVESFVPAPPPGTAGTPIFSDVDLTSTSADAELRNTDPNAVVCVTGANRGIGLQVVQQMLERTKGKIVACCRQPQTAKVLQDLQKDYGSDRLALVALDLQDDESMKKAAKEITQFSNGRLDALWNVAGILGDGGKTTPGPERSISQMDRSWFEQTMAVNVIGPVLWTKEMAPLLWHRTKRKRKTDKDAVTEAPPRPAAVVVNLSARVGSISDNGLGGWYSYRMSKTALNQATRTMAHEFKRQETYCIALHPGTTNTDLSKPFQANVKEGSLFPVEFTVSQLINIVDSMTAEHSGGLYDWSGKALSF